MMKAHIRDGVAVNVCRDKDLAKSFHPDLAAEFVTVPDYVQVGWVRDAQGDWSSPSDIVDPSNPPTPE